VRFDHYAQLVFDCDGVIVDTNRIKESNIRQAALSVCDAATAERFVAYFVGNNGLPRETKIDAFFDDHGVRRYVLDAYNRLNAETIRSVEPAPAVRAFLQRWAERGVPLYLLSGADEAEVRDLVKHAGIASLFRGIFGGPVTKMEHLERLRLVGPTCYFGDSRYDYEVARRFGLDFVFMSRHTQFAGWPEFFSDKPQVTVVRDFESLH